MPLAGAPVVKMEAQHGSFQGDGVNAALKFAETSDGTE